jgi:hypothetical protein
MLTGLFMIIMFLHVFRESALGTEISMSGPDSNPRVEYIRSDSHVNCCNSPISDVDRFP